MNTLVFNRQSRQRGFGMIEVLITMVILAIGLLGITGLQLTSLRANQISQFRTQATWAAYDLSDRMRANMEGVDAGAYDNPTPTAVDACLTVAGCSTDEMAQNDAFEWIASLQSTLPQGTGTVCIDSTPNDGTPAAPACDGGGSVYAIKIWWDDDRDGNLDRFEMSFQP